MELYRRAFEKLGQPAREIGVHSSGHVADTDEQAREEFWACYQPMRDRIGAERGWPPIGHAQYIREVEQGSLYVGAPETVARKIAATLKTLGASRFDLKYSVGRLSHSRLLRGIELYGTKVAPLVREMTAEPRSG
jgi:alkanesulfonate monooxygenase SsuD/methylene tetrahydromethanopterin reductase-like flavin-dependent oxidoreductase (luciferase family)